MDRCQGDDRATVENDRFWNQEQHPVNNGLSHLEMEYLGCMESLSPHRTMHFRKPSMVTAASSIVRPGDDMEPWISTTDDHEKNMARKSAVSRNSTEDASDLSQIPNTKILNSTDTSGQSPHVAKNRQDKECERSDNDASGSDDDTHGEKSPVSSFFATAAIVGKSWRDVTLGNIIDSMTSIIPEVTSGDISSLAQIFFDNLSTVLASLYAIQDLAKIQPPATTPSDSTFVADESIDKSVSLATMNKILFENIAPGLGLALFLGNTYYTWMASRQKRKFGRDYTALPTGMSTPYAFFMVFNVICKCWLSPTIHFKDL